MTTEQAQANVQSNVQEDVHGNVLSGTEAKVQAVIFDWAGTTVDYGCFAPMAAFIKVFEKRGILLTADEARGPMGMLKRDHLKALLALERVERLWREKFGSAPDESAIDEMYVEFEANLFAELAHFTEVVPGIVALVDDLRARGIRIGSTTGYTSEMLAMVAKEAERQGYKPDFSIASDEVPAGRPAPYMCYRNAIALEVYPLSHCVKVGDTVTDIKEGLAAGMWSVGIIQGGSELGLTLAEVEALSEEELLQRSQLVRERFTVAGAHYVVNTVSEVARVIRDIENRLAEGRHPAAAGRMGG